MEELGTSDWHSTCTVILVPAQARNYKTGEIANDQLFSKVLCEAQDLVEFALVVPIIAFGATTGIGKLSSRINTPFGVVG